MKFFVITIISLLVGIISAVIFHYFGALYGGATGTITSLEFLTLYKKINP